MNSKQRFNKKRMAAFNARKASEVDTKRRSKIGATDVLALLVIQFRDTKQEECGATKQERRNHSIFYKDTNPFGNKIHAVQKARGKSMPLI